MKPCVAVSEASFQASVIQLAKMCGWLAYHTHNSRRSEPGFPDLVLVKPPRVVFAELKTAKGKPSPAQERWLAALAASPVESYLWRPDDWDQIRSLLTR